MAPKKNKKQKTNKSDGYLTKAAVSLYKRRNKSKQKKANIVRKVVEDSLDNFYEQIIQKCTLTKTPDLMQICVMGREVLSHLFGYSVTLRLIRKDIDQWHIEMRHILRLLQTCAQLLSCNNITNEYIPIINSILQVSCNKYKAMRKNITSLHLQFRECMEANTYCVKLTSALEKATIHAGAELANILAFQRNCHRARNNHYPLKELHDKKMERWDDPRARSEVASLKDKNKSHFRLTKGFVNLFSVMEECTAYLNHHKLIGEKRLAFKEHTLKNHIRQMQTFLQTTVRTISETMDFCKKYLDTVYRTMLMTQMLCNMTFTCEDELLNVIALHHDRDYADAISTGEYFARNPQVINPFYGNQSQVDRDK